MSRITVEYTGDYHCEAVHGPSGSVLTTDLPPDNGGKGEFFSPTDLIATSLATCILTIMGKVAERLEVDLSGARCEVEKEMIADPDRRIRALRSVISMPGGLTEKQRTVLERAALTCPVHRSLDDRIEIPIRFDYDERPIDS
jgi:putative redox protein